MSGYIEGFSMDYGLFSSRYFRCGYPVSAGKKAQLSRWKRARLYQLSLGQIVAAKICYLFVRVCAVGFEALNRVWLLAHHLAR